MSKQNKQSTLAGIVAKFKYDNIASFESLDRSIVEERTGNLIAHAPADPSPKRRSTATTIELLLRFGFDQ
jgi:hypothetical protein